MPKYYSQTAPDWTGVQVGTISMMPKDDTGAYYAPDGWMECNGRTINPNEYLGLYQVIQNTYGGSASGDFPSISGDFKIPDLRDRRVVGTGRLRPDGASPALEGLDAGTVNTCGSFGGKNNITLADVSTRVQLVTGSVQSVFNTSRVQQSSTQFTDGTVDVNSGFLANHTMPHWPSHSHGNFWAINPAGTFTADRTSPGGGDTQVQGGASSGPNSHDGSQCPAVGGAGSPHSHWIGWNVSGSSSGTGFGDSQPADGDPNTAGVYDANGNALIKPTASMLQWNVQYSPVDATQITYGLDVDLGLDGTPDLQPEYQETSYMIFAGVSSSAYTAPPAPPAGDTVPDQVGPFNIGVTTASGDAVVTFVLNGVSSNYSFDVEVIKSGGQSVGATPINLNGTGNAVNTGYVNGDTISMTLEAPSSGGTISNYEIRVKYNTVTQMTAVANITYEAAPTVELSVLPTTVTSGSAINVTYAAPGATSVVASNFGASVPAGATIVQNPTVTTTYTITLGNTWGNTTATAVVNIAAANAPQINMSATPTSIDAGSSATISYSCTNADTFVSCSSSPVDAAFDSACTSAANIAFFTQAVSPAVDTTYTVTLSNANGSASQSATLTVVAVAAPTVTLTTDVTVIEQGNYNPNDDTEATLTWSSTDADDIGGISGSSTPTYSQWNPTTDAGTLPVGPQEDTTFTITATNDSGSDSASVNISVFFMPEITLTVTRAYTPSGGSASYSYVSGQSTSALPWMYFCCEEAITVGWAITGTASTVTGGVFYGDFADDGTNPSGNSTNSNLGTVSGNATSGTWSSIKIAPTENGSTAGGSNAVSANKRQGMILIQASNTMGQEAASAIRFKILTFRVARYSDYQDIAYFNQSGSTSNVGMYFDGTGNLVTTGSGTASVTFNFGWNDDPNDYGTALGNYSISTLGISFDQNTSTQTGSDSATVTVTGGTTYTSVVTGTGGWQTTFASNFTVSPVYKVRLVVATGVYTFTANNVDVGTNTTGNPLEVGSGVGAKRYTVGDEVVDAGTSKTYKIQVEEYFGTGTGGYHVENSSTGGVNQKFCVWDSDGTDCNAWVEVASITQQGATLQFGPISTNESYVDVSPASVPAGSTWNCSSIICHIGSSTGELFGKVTNGKFRVEDITGANSDNDYYDLTVSCNVSDFTGASTNANTAATGNFAIQLPAGVFTTSDINTLWSPADGNP